MTQKSLRSRRDETAGCMNCRNWWSICGNISIRCGGMNRYTASRKRWAGIFAGNCAENLCRKFVQEICAGSKFLHYSRRHHFIDGKQFTFRRYCKTQDFISCVNFSRRHRFINGNNSCGAGIAKRRILYPALTVQNDTALLMENNSCSAGIAIGSISYPALHPTAIVQEHCECPSLQLLFHHHPGSSTMNGLNAYHIYATGP